jgi:hypothetical protein
MQTEKAAPKSVFHRLLAVQPSRQPMLAAQAQQGNDGVHLYEGCSALASAPGCAAIWLRGGDTAGFYAGAIGIRFPYWSTGRNGISKTHAPSS